MIVELDYSEKMLADLCLIDQECFNEIDRPTDELSTVLKKYGNYRVFLDYENGEPAAYIGLMYAATLHYDGLWIDLLATRPQFRSKGIATKFTELALKLAKEEGLDCVTAIVRPTNHSSMGVFEKLGFDHSPEDFTLLSKDII